MRPFLALLLATTALPAFAETIPATSRITAVTVYPDGARITREVSFTVPQAGAHDLLVTDLPMGTAAGLMRIDGADGLTTGAFALRDDRLPPSEPALTAAQTAAQAEIDRLEAAERAAMRDIDAVQVRLDAAEVQVRFLGSFSGELPATMTPEALLALASTIGSGTQAAAEAAALARDEIRTLNETLGDVQQDLQQARDAYAALPGQAAETMALTVAVEAAAAGATTVTVTHFIGNAGWRPYYEMDLTRSDGTASLEIDRSVLVTQYTGEDWSGVDLTLSTSRPSDQAAPSTLWPELRSIGPEQKMAEMERSEDSLMVAEPEPAMAPLVAQAGMEGDTVVYTYPRKVDVAAGVEDLRLALDTMTLSPDVVAQAVPRWDTTAFVMASFVNGDEPILPGEALIFREGVLVGQISLGLIGPGVETDLAFGALDSVVISRDMPDREQGQSGFLTTTNEFAETAVLVIENLGDEAWPIRVLDQVPYSEQTDLAIQTTLSPQPSETDVDGQKGILAWTFDLAPGAKQEITVGYSMEWPEGQVLQ